MKRSKRVELDRLTRRLAGMRWKMPTGGMSLAAFEAFALSDVPPPDVLAMVRSLHSRQVIFMRRNRGEVRIFAARPTEIAGVFQGSTAIDRLLSSVSPHARRLADALQAREASRACGNTVGANAARDALDVSAARFIDLTRKHEARGTALTEIRETFWKVFAFDVMTFLSTFEPAFERKATSALPPNPIPKSRISNGLAPHKKVAALIEKAGPEGLCKSDLYQGIRPKLPTTELTNILRELTDVGLIEAMAARVRGRRFATRYVATTVRPPPLCAAAIGSH